MNAKKTNLFIGMAFTAMSIMSCSGNSVKTEAVAEKEPTQTESAQVVNEQTDEQSAPQEDSWMPADAVITSSGLGIVIENPGDDARATPTTPVTLHYRGKLTNGRVFDSSYDRGEPATFRPCEVVPGFGEGISMIGNGGKATLYIPGNLAYGPREIPQIGIGQYENLIFDVEIIRID